MVAAVVLTNLSSQAFYVAVSRGGEVGFNELRLASAMHLLDELRTKMRNPRPSSPVLSDSNNIVLAKVESLYARSAGIMFPTQSFLSFDVPEDRITLRPPFVTPALRAAGLQLELEIRNYTHPAVFEFARDGACYADDFLFDARSDVMLRSTAAPLLMKSTPEQSIFNRWHYGADLLHSVDVGWYSTARNDLVQVISSLARGYYFGNRVNVAVFQLEKDRFFEHGTMAAVGRYIFFRILNPTKRFRLEVTYTQSLRPDGKNRIPPIAIEGDRRFGLQVIGRGSARLFSPPLSAKYVRGDPFLLLDFGQEPTRFRAARTGLNRLYGNDVPVDSRFVTGFVRDISLVSDDEYERRRAPSEVHRFPEDLADEDLEYSGVYENGWISEISRFGLRQPDGSARVVVKGLVPLIGGATEFHSRLSVFVDGTMVATEQLGIGGFVIEAPVVNRGRIHDVRLEFGRTQHLPGPNPWPVSARLEFVGFEQGEARANTGDGTGAGRAWEYGERWGPAEHFAGQTFRWIDNDARIYLRPSVVPQRLSIDVEGGPGVGKSSVLHIFDDRGAEVARAPLGDRRTLDVVLPANRVARTYELHVDGGGKRIPTDPRILNFRVFSIGIVKDLK